MAIDIRRREFIFTLGGAAVAWPLAVRAQQSERVRRIGVLVPFTETNTAAQSHIAEFKRELQKLGWSEGRNVIVKSRFGGGDSERVRTHAAELLGMTPDVMLAETTQAMLGLQQTTRTVPTVFVNVADPVEAGFVSNLARPEGNITGFANIDIATTGKWLELLREITPGLSQVLVIFDPKNPITPRRMRAIETAAQSLSIQLTRAAIHHVGDIEHAIKTFAESRMVVWLRWQVLLWTIIGRSSPHQRCSTACSAADQVPAGDQPQDRQGARPHCAGSSLLGRADEVIE